MKKAGLSSILIAVTLLAVGVIAEAQQPAKVPRIGYLNDSPLGSFPKIRAVSRYFPPAVPKVYIVSFRTYDDRRPSKFIVLADSMKSAIKMAWDHGGADFQSRFDKSIAQADQMTERTLRFL